MQTPIDFVRAHWTFTLLALPGAAACLWVLFGHLRPAPRHLCPGHAPRWTQDVGLLALIRRWFSFQHCGYDLSGSTPGPFGVVRCPECGRNVHPFQKVRATHGLKRCRVAGTLLLALLLIWNFPGYRQGAFVAQFPDTWLIELQAAAPRLLPQRIAQELESRICGGTLNPRNISRLTPILLHELRDDDIPGNGVRATRMLDNIACLQLDTLERFLDSPDTQQRRLVAGILRECGWYSPSQRYFEVLIESISDDRPPTAGRRTPIYNACEARRVLFENAHEAQPALASALRSPDKQIRFDAAHIVGQAQVAPLYGAACPILLEHSLPGTPQALRVRAKDALQGMGRDTLDHLKARMSPHTPWGRGCRRFIGMLQRPELRP